VSLLAQMRSQSMHQAFQQGCDRVLFVDDDILFQPRHALALLNEPWPDGVTIAGGLYAQRNSQKLAAHGVDLNQLLTKNPFAPGFPRGLLLGVSGFVRTDFLGAGFLAVSRGAWSRMVDNCGQEDVPHYFQDSGFEGGTYPGFFFPVIRDFMGQRTWLGEDYSFCQTARDCGLQVHIATEPLLGHISPYPWFAHEAKWWRDGRLRTGPAAFDQEIFLSERDFSDDPDDTVDAPHRRGMQPGTAG
jgi:hypothetical protein